MRYAWLLTLMLGLGSDVWAKEYTRFPGSPARRLAVQGLHVLSDRWPDTHSLRSFALDVVRLERARTEEEEALALYSWIARLMTIGGSPYEGPPGGETVVADTLKYLNVYGNHWCDGNARLLETAWRALGREGFRLYIPMRHHSLVELLWRDADGRQRWHALDVNNGWFVRNDQGWIASSEDIERNPLLVLAANQDLKMRTKGWLHTRLSPMPNHSMAIHLRRGESYALRWDNEGFYYVNPRTRATVSADNALYRLFIPEDVGEVRWMAARALGRIGDPRAVEPLMQILPDACGDLGLFVARALGELGDRRAVPVLVEQSRKRNEPELRGIAEALGMLGDTSVIAVLQDLITTGKQDVRRAAKIALERLKDPSKNR